MTAVDALLAAALAHHQAGRAALAEGLYRQVLAAAPDHAEALHLLGVLLHQRGEHADAMTLMRRALRAGPGVAKYHNNLGSALNALKESSEALACFRQAIALQPDYADAHYNQGVALTELGRLDAAAASFRAAISLAPAHVPAHYNLALLHKRQCSDAAAAAGLAEVLRLQPELETARHLLAALTGAATERAPATYVAATFDAAAERFDEHLVKELGYDAPQQLLAMLAALPQLPPRPWDVLDLGCGTGLAGVALAAHARRVVGVDLSANMLARARARGLYARLEQAEMCAMMAAEPAAAYDVIVAADVLIYTGRLDELAREVRRLLRPGGCFAFSVESLEDARIAGGDGEYRLLPSGRYAHADSYLRRLARANDMRIRASVSAPIRHEAGRPIAAWLAVWQG
ncbi:MAG: tetratricopeptide repeat protein [Rhodocyclaceae bacterium]|nr:tetratricopeptide repeat protein [Rhodocyclaceae bacterium]